MRLRTGCAIAALALLGLLREASACGYCVEDKVAATYDHAAVTRALSRGHHVAFFHIDGPLSRQDATRRALEGAAYSMPGVDKGSARISLETLTLSVAFDPQRVSLVKINAHLDRKLAVRKLSFVPFRTMEETADLKSVKRR